MRNINDGYPSNALVPYLLRVHKNSIIYTCLHESAFQSQDLDYKKILFCLGDKMMQLERTN